ncbi:DUF305 domain-containing protein [Nocardia takedensis]|uniref:DUF305 domain-containing protein n=1 Tax=Nocardia takedensis TaxID=259390 RepID=UPI003F76B36A
MTLDSPDRDLDDRPATASAAGDTPARRAGPVLLALTLSAGLILGIGVGWRLDRAPQARHSAVDVGFAQDMSTHHGQAVEMSALASTRTGDPEIRALAYDVITTQQSQIGTMQGWLALWDQPATAPGAAMTWMSAKTPAPMPAGHDMTGMGEADTTMPGMAGTQDMRRLRQSSGSSADVLYLQLLLRHHEGGLPMARYAAANAAEPVVARLAATIEATQSAESDTIRALLAQRGAAPLGPN